MQATTVREALRASLAGTFGTVLSVLPRLIVFAIALAVGWAISSLLARGTIAVLRAVRFDETARRSGLARFIQQMGVQQDPTGAVASVAKWLVRLMTLVVALDTLGLPAGSGVLHQLLLWLPNLAVALVALVIGGLAATALSRLVRGSATVAGLPNPQVLAAATSIAVWAFVIVLAVSQLGIATSVVDLGLVGVVGGIALAAGLAFGWAGRERAAQVLSSLEGRHASPSGAAGSESPAAAASFPSATVSFDSPASPAMAGGSATFSPDAAPDTPVSSVTAQSSSARLPDIVASVPPPSPGDLASAPVLDPSAPAADGSANDLEAFGAPLDASVTEFDPTAPGFDPSAPGFDPSSTEFHASTPEFDGSTAEFGASAQGRDAQASELVAPFPGLEVSAPALHPSTPLLDPFADEPTLFPADELEFEPAHVTAFEESWIPRSGLDRRRIARPGPDRRASGA
jgi:Conserved TM helix